MIQATIGSKRKARILAVLRPFVNVSFRGASIIARFILTFYIVQYIGIEASGIYGLAIGAIGLCPSIVGMGLNYLISREVVGLERRQALTTLKDRYLMTVVSLSVLTVSVLLILGWTETSVVASVKFVVILVWMETLALDTHLALIGMELAFEANVMVFIRSALWVVPVIIIGIILPEFRSINIVFVTWMGFHVISAIYFMYAMRRERLLSIIVSKPDVSGMVNRIKQSKIIYLSDLGLAGSTYIDRYVVGLLVGLSGTGVYSFFWSLANSLQTLVATAIVQLAMPSLVRAYRTRAYKDWSALLFKNTLISVVLASILAIFIFLFAKLLLNYVKIDKLVGHDFLFIVLLITSVTRVASDMANVGLTSAHLDKEYAAINIGSVLVSVSLSIPLVWYFGVEGAGVSSLIVAGAALLVRMIKLRGLMSVGVYTSTGAIGDDR